MKLSIASKFTKARLKLIIVIVQSETEIVQTIQIVQRTARINSEFFSK